MHASVERPAPRIHTRLAADVAHRHVRPRLRFGTWQNDRAREAFRELPPEYFPAAAPVVALAALGHAESVVRLGGPSSAAEYDSNSACMMPSDACLPAPARPKP